MKFFNILYKFRKKYIIFNKIFTNIRKNDKINEWLLKKVKIYV